MANKPLTRKKERTAESRSAAAKREAVREGVSAANRGETVPHDKVRRWLLSWGGKNELPRPKTK
jgi:predicted transcriptional regulator